MIAAKLEHEALFYASDEDYVAALGPFVRAGLEAGEAVLVAVPTRNLQLLRDELADTRAAVRFVDMRQQGVNPARILPSIRELVDAHPGRPVRFVGEPIWAGRTSEEIVEGHRHEALINEALALTPARIVCPYDVRTLDPAVLLDAKHTHPNLVENGRRRASRQYADPRAVYCADGRPLHEPEGQTVTLELLSGLASFRRAVEAYAVPSGLEPERVASFVLAANEAAANTIAHAGGDGAARLWRDDWSLVCELTDSGRIDDPLVGRRTPSPEQDCGRGVWLMNHVSDLVELRSGESGTVVRIHMRLD
jgi:anti-sigma regulatory factor (Ser/Thr protein kinase)